jgi:hypothetical protein
MEMFMLSSRTVGIVHRLILLLSISLLAGCGTSIFSLRVPLAEATRGLAADAPNIVIEDQRPAAELAVHTGGSVLGRCERWYGDDTYVPSKLVYLEQLLAERFPVTTVRVRLQRFDTVEYCDNTANTEAVFVPGAGGSNENQVFVTSRDIPGGDSVFVRLVGDINGVPFDASREFDYSDLPHGFVEMPASNPAYRERLKRAMRAIADEIAANLPATSLPTTGLPATSLPTN